MSLVIDTLIIQILALYLDFDGAKIIHVLLILILGFSEGWRFLTGVWHLDLDLDMVTGFLIYTCSELINPKPIPQSNPSGWGEHYNC